MKVHPTISAILGATSLESMNQVKNAVAAIAKKTTDKGRDSATGSAYSAFDRYFPRNRALLARHIPYGLIPVSLSLEIANETDTQFDLVMTREVRTSTKNNTGEVQKFTFVFTIDRNFQ